MLVLKRYHTITCAKTNRLWQVLERIAQNDPLKPFVRAIGEAKVAALPDFHALTGAYRLGSSAGHGKLTCWKTFKEQTTAPSQLWQILSLLAYTTPLGVRYAKRRQQCPELTILSHVSCFIQGEVIGFQVFIHVVRGCPCNLLQLPRGSCWDLCGICFIWHSGNMAEQGETPYLDNSQKCGCLVGFGCPFHLIISNMVVPFDS